MGKHMSPLPFGVLAEWMLEEYRGGSVFGIRKEKFYKGSPGPRMKIFGDEISSPVGPAAGPNSQLAQNIVAACLAGGRFVELKTVQAMDGEELAACVPRPCINARDEGYNVEWSTELTVEQAFGEYVKAWILLHVFVKEFGLSDKRDFIFNMSVGYSLDGIRSAKVDGFIEGMKQADTSPVWRECISWLNDNIGRFHHFTLDDISGISSAVSPGVTLSTLHGCPKEEIERIAAYLLEEKGLHTYIKCNPTLLGYDTARGLLDSLGFTYVSFDDYHFRDDLQFDDAVPMLRRLQAKARSLGLEFGVKLTNTFPVEIRREELPGSEMYMSGRALLPLSLGVARKLARAFDGDLAISYSGGADALNTADLLRTGIRPVTVATTILKPGGYERLSQIAASAETAVNPDADRVDAGALDAFAERVAAEERYKKGSPRNRKTDAPLPLFDCFKSPCRDGGCAIHQQIPAYLELAAQGRFDKAFEVIARDNTAPSITGEICDHKCQSKCTRIDYDDPLRIRAIKKEASDRAQRAFVDALRPAPIKTGKRAAVIGAGPAGIAAAGFLRRNGVAVTVFEQREEPYGIVRYVIPEFRISAERIRRDYDLAVRTGVEFVFGEPPDYDIPALKEEYDYAVLATGAWEKGDLRLESGGDKALDALDFLREAKEKNCCVPLGKRAAVIGGGDVAMDCARAALRAPGIEQVYIVYRRTMEFMPAEEEELRLAISDGAEILELMAPVRYENNELICEVMRLGDYDSSGRRSVTGTGKTRALHFDTVICAVGARVDTLRFSQNGIALNRRGLPVINEQCETSIPDVYIAGDCKAGPATVVKAIADGKTIALDILRKLGLPNDFADFPLVYDEDILYAKKGLLLSPLPGGAEGFRCLHCDDVCELCCDVCPNRANVMVRVSEGFMQEHQILHIDGFCNECGNCGTFCPYDGLPYKDKLTVFWSREGFDDSENVGFLPLGSGRYLCRLPGGDIVECVPGDGKMPAQMEAVIAAIAGSQPYYLGGEANK